MSKDNPTCHVCVYHRLLLAAVEVPLLKIKTFPLTFPLQIEATLQHEVCAADTGPDAEPLSGLHVDVLNGTT